MHAYLLLLSISCSLALPLARASAEEPNAAESAEVNVRRARIGMGASSAGIVLSTVGVIAGGMLFPASYSCSAGTAPGAIEACDEARITAERQHRAGKVLLIISPIALAASIFGLVRSKRTLNKAYPKEPREPASWR